MPKGEEKTIRGSFDKLRKIRDLVEDGLMTDGEQHKQWHLWEIARIVGVDIDLDNTEGGIAP